MRNIQSTLFYGLEIFMGKMLFTAMLLLNFSVNAQVDLPINDSTKSIVKNNDSVEYKDIDMYTEAGLKISKSNYISSQLIRKQNILFDQIETEIQNAGFVIKKGIDFKNYATELKSVIDYKNSAINGIKNIDFQSVRNLTITSVMLNEILIRSEWQLKRLKENHTELTKIQNKLDSLVVQESMFILPEDSMSKTIYFARYKQMMSSLNALNKSFKNSLDSIQELVIATNTFKFELKEDIIEIEEIRKNKYQNLLFEKHAVFTGNTLTYLYTILYSITKETILMLFYITNHITTIITLILCIVFLFFYLKILKDKYVKAGIFQNLNYPVEIFNHPLASSLIISITIFQFVFQMPPFSFITILWTILLFSITTIIKYTASKEEFKIWKSYFPLILLNIFNNNIIINSSTESWIILILILTSIAVGIYNLKKSKNILSGTKKWMTYTMISFEIIAVLFLINGNYNLSKMFMTNGLFTVFIVYLLIISYQLLKDLVLFSSYLNDKKEEKQINFSIKEIHKMNTGIYMLCIAGWVILLSRNSYHYQQLLKPVSEAFKLPRNIANTTYTFEAIAVFFTVLISSFLISRIISFLATETKSITSKSEVKHSGLGSWVLIIRIGIILAGALIAFVSVGIPLDSITMIISALGIGIGLGLQTLVNNLVSGIIIAFEKPVNTNDIIEIGGQIGVMKSIGIRSSVVTTWDGADVIIPNGDLLEQHLKNWTLGNSKRRLNIKVGVAYDADLKKVKTIIAGILDKHQNILKNPPPSILITDFNDNSIDVDIKFWVPDFNMGPDVKSDLIIDINTSFNENNIVIPFPQQDIHIVQKDTDTEENKSN